MELGITEKWNSLPTELTELFAPLIEQPPHIGVIFQYGLYLLDVEAGRMKLIESISVESGKLLTFENEAGVQFRVIRPSITQEQETILVEQLREIFSPIKNKTE